MPFCSAANVPVIFVRHNASYLLDIMPVLFLVKMHFKLLIAGEKQCYFVFAKFVVQVMLVTHKAILFLQICTNHIGEK